MRTRTVRAAGRGPWHPTPYRGEGVEPRGDRQFFDFLMLHHTLSSGPLEALRH